MSERDDVPPSIPPSIPPKSRRERPRLSDAKPVSKRGKYSKTSKPSGASSSSGSAGSSGRSRSNGAGSPKPPSSPNSEAQHTLRRQSIVNGEGKPRQYRRSGTEASQSSKAAASATTPPSYTPRRSTSQRSTYSNTNSSDGGKTGSSAALPPSFAPASRAGAAHTERLESAPSISGGRDYARNRGGNGQGGQVAARYTPSSINHSQNPSSGSRLTSEPRPAGTAPRRRRRRKAPLVFLILFLILVLAWPIGLLMWASSKIQHVDALSDGADTPGTTYLIAGSDARDGTEILDDTEGRRADTIMVLHKARGGPAYLVSIPRDTWVEVPGYGEAKINASYSYGGEIWLVETVEHLTGLKVDHFVEIGMSGVTDIVDALGGVQLCLDFDVDDPKSELVWKAGCHEADGHTALAFARMRYSDPKGDIGRAERQRQVVSSVVKEATKPSNLLNPLRHRSLASAATGSLVTDHDTSAFDLARMAWYFKKASSAGLTGAPPIASLNLPTVQGSAVKLDEELAPVFFQKLSNGTLKKEDFNVTTY